MNKRGNLANQKKDIYENLQQTSYLNEEKLKAFNLKLGTRQGYLLLFLFNSLMEILASAVMKSRKIKNIEIRKKTRNKASITDDYTACKENSEVLSGFNINIQKVNFVSTATSSMKMKVRKL